MINVTEMLENSSAKHPDKVAFADPYSEVTFGELESTAKSIAVLLLKGSITNKVSVGDSVAFFLEKSTSSVKVMFAALYAGAFYSYIDVRSPAERTSKILDTLAPKIIVTDDVNEQTIRTAVSDDFNNIIINISKLIGEASSVNYQELCLVDKIKQEYRDILPLYVNFTSGSTGTPKGVVVSHRSVIDFIKVFTETFSITDKDIIANQAPFDFDVSIKDIFSGLYTGASVNLIPREYFSNPVILMDYLYERKVTTLIWAVSAMCFVSIMNGLEYKTPETINKVMFSGEVMPVKQLNKWKNYLPQAVYVNLYGPTEITCNCTYYILDREFEKNEVIPIGIPFANEKVFLLSENNKQITGEDIEGEICVSGTCLALGYYKDKEKTSLSFVQNPLNDSYIETIYRTGDLGKYNSDGLLVYTSRKDFQIKHMGQRIELGEIDVAATSIDGVSRACTIYDKKHKKILLFYTGEIDKDEVFDKLHEKLPPFMFPGKVTRLEEFVLNKNGKIDRKVLEEMK